MKSGKYIGMSEQTMKTDAQKRKVLTIYLDASVAHKFKARASMEGKSMTSIIRDLVASYVKPESSKGNGQI